MDIGAFYRFLRLGEAKSLSAAAKRAFMSRQAFAESMTKLENELGVTLYVHHGRSLVLTAAGEELLRFLREWLPEWERERKTLERLEKREPATIRVAVCFSNLAHVFGERMVRFETERENLKVEIRDTPPEEAFTQLDRHTADLVLMLDSGERAGCVRLRLPETGTQPLLLMHESHPLAAKTEIRVGDLRGVNMVLVNPGTERDPMLDRYAVPFGAVPVYIPVRNEAYSLNVMKVRQAVGLTSARRPNRFEKDGFVTRPLTDYPYDLSCYAYYRKNAPAAVKELAAALVK